MEYNTARVVPNGGNNVVTKDAAVDTDDADDDADTDVWSSRILPQKILVRNADTQNTSNPLALVRYAACSLWDATAAAAAVDTEPEATADSETTAGSERARTRSFPTPVPTLVTCPVIAYVTPNPMAVVPALMIPHAMAIHGIRNQDASRRGSLPPVLLLRPPNTSDSKKKILDNTAVPSNVVLICCCGVRS